MIQEGRQYSADSGINIQKKDSKRRNNDESKYLNEEPQKILKNF